MAAPRLFANRGVAVGATIMVLTQVAMVAIMTMTPVHMRHHHHGLGQVGFIGIHVGAMFLPSLITGSLVDRLGRLPMATASAVILLAAGVVAALAPGDSLSMLTLALALLGLGWNIGLISGTAIIVDSSGLSSRGRTQGAVDVLMRSQARPAVPCPVWSCPLGTTRLCHWLAASCRCCSFLL